MIRRFPTLAKAAALLAAAFGVWAGVPAQAKDWAPDPEDQLLLELRSGAYRLGEPLRGYQTPQGVCVDFADLIQALDLPVRLDKKSRRATGWLFAEDQRLILDRDSNTVQTVNNSRGIGAGAIVDTPEGWCMDLAALSAWMGVRFKADLGNLAIKLESDRKLPFLEAIERRSRAARLRSPALAEFDLAKLPQAQAPYQNWRTPSVDVQIQGQWNNRSGATMQYEALAAGEALGMSFTARLAGNGGLTPDSLRLRLFRNDPEGGMLGPMQASQIALGDVETLRGGLTGQGTYGRGVFISNQPLARGARFGLTSLRGTLPAGWDAELYRNGELRAFQADRGDGRYQFDDIELLFGENDFEVVLYGPQGQIKRERSSMPVGQDNVTPGQTQYWAGVLDSHRDLIDLSRTFVSPQTGWRWGVGVERGIDRRTTLGLEYQSLMLGGRRRHYLEATLRRGVGPMLLELAGARQLGGGRALRVDALGRLGPVRFDAHVLWVKGDFESELVTAQQRREYSLRLNSALHLGNWRLPVEGAVRQTLTRDGTKVNEWLVRGAFHAGRVTLTAELLRRSASGPALGLASGDLGTKLNLIGNTALGGLRLRGTTRFALSGPRHGFEAVQLVAEKGLGRASTLRGGYEYDKTAGRGEWMLGYVQQFRRFALRAEARADSNGRKTLGLTLGFSLGPDPVDGGWRLSRERLAEEGQASIEVFRDDNGDGYRQAGEAAVEGVNIEAGFRHAEKATNQAGRAVIDGLMPYVPVLVSIDAGTLPDPLLQPKTRGMVVVPRPGVAAKVVLPLAPTGEIEAVLLGPDGEPRAGVPVELVDASGRTVLTAPSDFDGYLLFDSVPYGQYRLRVAAGSAAVLGVRAELGGALRLDRDHASLRLGKLRLVADAPAQVAASGP
ncbi:collagen binding domain-containing protein [Novosphingobium sp.]|uniref:MSCRAMM family protein n=1 Tax=Novosphingobium sp. TaxID=1874826 RepID=UPI0035AE5CE4